jgi:mannose-6-phosphate isomerase class I
MVNSDNVIRGGLTPKHKDTATLLKLLDFKHAPQFDAKAGNEIQSADGVSVVQYLDEAFPELRILRVSITKG